MPDTSTKPIGDSIAKVDDAVAVGEDLDFQRGWWRFERVAWTFFSLIILCDVLGLFGRGFLSRAKADAPNGALQVNYERLERAGTPSIMTFRFGPSAVRDGRIQLFVSESVVRGLGAARVSPQPAESALGQGGITYTFPASDATGVVQIALEPSFPGVHRFSAGLSGAPAIQARVIVFP